MRQESFLRAGRPRVAPGKPLGRTLLFEEPYPRARHRAAGGAIPARAANLPITAMGDDPIA